MNSDFWTAIGSAATAIALGFTAAQIFLVRRQERTQFEDNLVKEYRELLATLPREVLMQEPAAESVDCVSRYLPQFYRYFDLCNEEIFLRQKNRIRKDTWNEWRTGIEINLRRPGFHAAWKEVQDKTSSFADLRCLCANGDVDPRSRRWRLALGLVESELKRRGESCKLLGTTPPLTPSSR